MMNRKILNANKMTGNFRDKPKTQEFFSTISAYVETLGPSKRTVKAQVSISVKRKFLWFWAYDKTPDGTLYMTVCLDREVDDPHFHYVNHISTNRWNHHVVIKSRDMAKSGWLRRLVRTGYEFANK